jgi:hypothetical protein
MKASEFIKIMQDLVKKHGDLPVMRFKAIKYGKVIPHEGPELKHLKKGSETKYTNTVETEYEQSVIHV